MFEIEKINLASAGVQKDLLVLNNEHEKETSFLTPGAWRHLITGSYDATCVGSLGFLITFDQAANYDSPNFVWFKQKYQRFVYVDRIVVSAAARGQGIARRLYEHLFEAAKHDGIRRIVCEINCDPPNPGSDAFHAQLGFSEVGRAVLKTRSKTVRYMSREL